MYTRDWNEQAKRLLKAELVRRGINNDELVELLAMIGVDETKAGIDSKISRGTFSAAFFIQCMNAIGCKTINAEVELLDMAAEPKGTYKKKKTHSKK
ncbi:MAG TPA: DUF6471 domain-containing protein [Bacteroidia bacterium]|nr:DUF6471 domain-containing protein [Bacteroidia bacterium]